MKNRNTGITLIALVITIIVLLILAGIVISLTIGENGMINKAKESGLIYDEQQAKEKLELVLLDMQADKVTNVEYNQNEYLTEKIEEKDMIVNGDIVLVNGWQFQIDRSVPEIAASLGKGKLNENIRLNVTATNSSDYTKSVIKVEIEYVGEIKYISIAGEEIVVPEKIDGKYIVEKEVTANGNYIVVAKDTEDKYQIGSVRISDLEEDVNTYDKNDMLLYLDGKNGPEEDIWKDRSGNDRNAKMTGNYTYDTIKKCYTFLDETGLGKVKKFKYTNGITISYYVELLSDKAGSRFYIGNGYYGPANFRPTLGVSSTIVNFLAGSDGGTNLSHTIPLNSKISCAVAVDTLGNSKIYIDGILIQEIKMSMNINVLPSNDFRIHGYGSTSNQDMYSLSHIQGDLYNVLVYDKQLTNEEIEEIHKINQERYK